MPAGEGSGAAIKISTEARSGRYAAMLDVDAGNANLGGNIRMNYQQRFTADHELAEPGKLYRFSAYYRTEGDPRPRLTVQIPGDPHPTTGDLPPADDWTYVELEFVWPPAFGRFAVAPGRFSSTTRGSSRLKTTGTPKMLPPRRFPPREAFP